MKDIRSQFEEYFPLEPGVYWSSDANCYMRDAGGGFTVSVNSQNDKWEAWQAALEHAGQDSQLKELAYLVEGWFEEENNSLEREVQDLNNA